MKIEQLIVQYLYTNKKVTLQDIGIFHLSPNVTIPVEQDKDTIMPDNAISFEYNTKAVQDDGLIEFIVQQTRKIKPLATSDLESFTILGRQFMNIGKPLPIEGLGILQKNQHGEYEFIQGHSINPRLEPVPAALREKNKEEIVFTTPARKKDGKAGPIAVVVIFLFLIAAVAFYFVTKNNKDKKTDLLVTAKADTPVIKKDTAARLINPKKDSVIAMPPPAIAATGFRVVIRDYTTKATADNVFNKFKTYGHNLVQLSTDSTHFMLAMPFTKPLSDTARMKDSLKLIFGGNPYIDLN